MQGPLSMIWRQPIYRDFGGDEAAGTTVTNQSASSEPSALLRPYLEQLYAESGRLANTPSEFPSFPTTVGFAPETEAALSGTTDRAAAGSPLIGSANDELMRVLGGEYLGRENPYTQQVMDRTIATVRPRVDAAFSSAGRYGSGAHSRVLTDNITSAVAPILYGDYQAERGNQMSALGMAPGLAAQDYVDLTALLGVGQAREGRERELLGEEVARFNFPQEEPWQRATRFAEILSPGMRFGTSGGSSTQSAQQPARDPFMTLLGIGMAGASLAGNMGWSPFSSTGGAQPYATI